MVAASAWNGGWSDRHTRPMPSAPGLASLLLPLQPPNSSSLLRPTATAWGDRGAPWAPGAAGWPDGCGGSERTSAAAALARAAVGLLPLPLVARADAASPAWSGAVSAAKDAWNSGGACPLGFTSVNILKTYPCVDVPPTLSLLTPHKLLWLLLKNTGLVFLLQTNVWLYQALEAEEQALQAGTQAQLPPYPDVGGQAAKALWNSWRELCTALARSEIKHAIRARASSKLAWKVLKDPRDSVTRKALWYFSTPPWRLLPRYAKTLFQTQLPMYAAELLVACSYDALDEARRLLAAQPAKGAAGQLSEAQAAPLLQQLSCALQDLGARGRGALRSRRELGLASRRWALRAGKNLLRVSGTAVAAALGAGLAGSLAPRERAGVWAVRGHLVSDLVAANVLILLLDGGLGLVWPGGEQAHSQAPRPRHPASMSAGPHDFGGAGQEYGSM